MWVDMFPHLMQTRPGKVIKHAIYKEKAKICSPKHESCSLECSLMRLEIMVYMQFFILLMV